MPRLKCTSLITAYRQDLLARYWAFQQRRFPQLAETFEPPFTRDHRPPVFLPACAHHNVIIKPGATQAEKDRLYNLCPAGKKHKWFRSMNSSQALALSVLGNLAVYNRLDCLAELKDDAGGSLFAPAQVSPDNFILEYKIDYLGERRATSLDAFIDGPYRVAVECKFTEAEFGRCSRTSLPPSASNYAAGFCDGTFTYQRGRPGRCSLSISGVKYWQYLPQLFTWSNDCDLIPCPLHKNYQLVRNVLAAGVRPDGTASPENGHVVVLYDDRNPAFQENGAALVSYQETRSALKESTMLRKCSWQRLVQCMRAAGVLPWLAEELSLKYGI